MKVLTCYQTSYSTELIGLDTFKCPSIHPPTPLLFSVEWEDIQISVPTTFWTISSTPPSNTHSIFKISKALRGKMVVTWLYTVPGWLHQNWAQLSNWPATCLGLMMNQKKPVIDLHSWLTFLGSQICSKTVKLSIPTPPQEVTQFHSMPRERSIRHQSQWGK